MPEESMSVDVRSESQASEGLLVQEDVYLTSGVHIGTQQKSALTRRARGWSAHAGSG